MRRPEAGTAGASEGGAEALAGHGAVCRQTPPLGLEELALLMCLHFGLVTDILKSEIVFNFF